MLDLTAVLGNGGCYFAATEATEAESLGLHAAAVGSELSPPAAPALAIWDHALDVLSRSVENVR